MPGQHVCYSPLLVCLVSFLKKSVQAQYSPDPVHRASLLRRQLAEVHRHHRAGLALRFISFSQPHCFSSSTAKTSPSFCPVGPRSMQTAETSRRSCGPTGRTSLHNKHAHCAQSFKLGAFSDRPTATRVEGHLQSLWMHLKVSTLLSVSSQSDEISADRRAAPVEEAGARGHTS